MNSAINMADDTRAAGEQAARGGFTLLELLLSVAILALITSVTFMAISVLSRAWQRGTKLADNLHHGDFVIDQLAMGLRSAYYVAGNDAGSYGFSLEDNGDGAHSSDRISWVKLGGALVGKTASYVGSPHRTEFTIDEDEDGEDAVAIKAWRIYGQSEDFDPEDDVAPFYLSKRVSGFNCRPADPFPDDPEGEMEWLDDWEHSNSIPKTIEITLYLEPLEEGDEPLAIKRVVDVPVAVLSLPSKPWTKTTDR